MSDTFRKSLTVGIVLSTILWSMMASVLVAPLKASAAGCTSGSLIKGSLPAVYYCGSDGKRYVFTNDKAYKTWYADFSSVMTISDADLASIQIGGNVTYRPGVLMLKIQSDPKTYAIAHGGVLRHVPSEACAVTLYGSAWNTMIHDVSDAFFTNYSVGAAINASCSDYNKTAEMSSSQSINADKNLSTAGVSGTASVSLASDSPAGATLPKGATGVNFLKFNVSNNGGSAMVADSVTLRRVGPGATTDLSSVYLYEGSSRLTTGRSVNSSTNEVTFTGLNLSLAAGQTRTLWVAVDIATGAAAGNVHAMELSKAMSGTTQLSGSPFTGNNFTLAGTTVGSLTIAKTGTITAPKAGEMEAKIAEFTVAAGSSEDVRFERLTIFQGGNLSAANLTNLKLKQAGLTIATAASFDANLRATFSLSAPGMLLEKGATKTFQVYGDIGGGARAADSLKLYTEESSDVRGVGQTFGQGVTVTRTAYDGDSCTSSAGDCSYSTVEAGPVTVALKGPFPTDRATYAKDAELLRFTMVVQNRTEVRRMQIKLTASTSGAGASGLINTSTPNYTDVKIINTTSGAAWWGPSDLSGTGDAGANDLNQTLTFTDVQSLEPGVVYEFAVTADASTSITSGESVTATRLAFGTSDLRNTDNSTFLTPSSDVVPSGDMAGFAQTMYSAYLGAGLNSLAVSQSYVKGATSILALGLSFGSETGTVTKLSSLTIKGFIDADGSSDYVQGQDVDVSGTVSVSDVITSCWLIDAATGAMRGQPKSPTSGTGGVMTFAGLDWDIDSIGATGLLYCDLSNGAYLNSNAERIAFKVVANTDATVQDAVGNSVSFAAASFPINGTPSVVLTTANSGTMTYQIAPDDTESEAGLVLANTTAVLGKIRLTAANEELKQTKIRISLVGAVQNSVVSMSLYDGAALVAGPVPMSGQNADFSGFNFVVPKDASKTLTVKAILNSISGGATSGADLQITTDLTTPTAGTFEYRGTGSSTVVSTIATTDVTGRNKVLRKTKPTVSLASLPTSTLTNGTMVLSRITVTADVAEQVSLKAIQWAVTKSNAGMLIANGGGQSAVREVGQGAHISGTTTQSIGCASNGGTACTFQSRFTSEQVISAGASKTYELVLTVAGAASNHSLITNIASDTDLVTGELASVAVDADGVDDLDGTNAATAIYNFAWSDNSAIPHNDVSGATDDAADAAASDDWTNGLYVEVLPTDAQSVLMP
ncbi:MAG: hypothetical protein AAB554_01020 [Patescibacteria group bacterium]